MQSLEIVDNPMKKLRSHSTGAGTLSIHILDRASSDTVSSSSSFDATATTATAFFNDPSSSPEAHGHAHQLMGEDQRTARLHKLFESAIVANWEDEYIRLHNEFAHIDAIGIKFPKLAPFLRRFSKPHWFYLALFASIVNVVLYGVSFIDNVPNKLISCYNTSYKITVSLSIVYPIYIFLVHIAFATIWSEKSSGAVRDYQHQNYPETLNLMLHYLNSLHVDRSTDQLVAGTDDSFYRTAIYCYITGVVAFWVLIITTSLVFEVANIQYTVVGVPFCFWPVAAQALYIPAYFVIAVSGLCNYLFFVMIYKSSTICSLLISSWIDRYKPLQRLRANDLALYMPANSKFSPQQLARVLRRDAFERYMLVRFFVKNVSDLWGYPLGYLIASSTLGTIALVVLIVVNDTPLSHITMSEMLPGLLVGFLLPIVLISWTNSSGVAINEALKYSMPQISLENNDYGDIELMANPDITKEQSARLLDTGSKAAREIYGDYELIGGRDVWLRYISENPIQWTVFGLAITPQIVATAIAGGATSVIAVAASTLLRQISYK